MADDSAAEKTKSSHPRPTLAPSDSDGAVVSAAAADGSGSSRRRSSEIRKARAELGYVPQHLSTARGPVLSDTRKLVLVMVGLPARGKSYMAKKMHKYLRHLRVQSKIFNFGSYRRAATADTTVGQASAAFFDPHNSEARRIREQCAIDAMTDMVQWCKAGGQVGILDGTNSNHRRRQLIRSFYEEASELLLHTDCPLTFGIICVESICTNDAIIRENIIKVKLRNPDYSVVDADQAMEDFYHRIAHYKDQYETVTKSEGSFIKVINVGTEIIAHELNDWLTMRILYFLSHVALVKRPHTSAASKLPGLTSSLSSSSFPSSSSKTDITVSDRKKTSETKKAMQRLGSVERRQSFVLWQDPEDTYAAEKLAQARQDLAYKLIADEMNDASGPSASEAGSSSDEGFPEVSPLSDSSSAIGSPRSGRPSVVPARLVRQPSLFIPRETAVSLDGRPSTSGGSGGAGGSSSSSLTSSPSSFTPRSRITRQSLSVKGSPRVVKSPIIDQTDKCVTPVGSPSPVIAEDTPSQIDSKLPKSIDAETPPSKVPDHESGCVPPKALVLRERKSMETFSDRTMITTDRSKSVAKDTAFETEESLVSKSSSKLVPRLPLRKIFSSADVVASAISPMTPRLHVKRREILMQQKKKQQSPKKSKKDESDSHGSSSTTTTVKTRRKSKPKVKRRNSLASRVEKAGESAKMLRKIGSLDSVKDASTGSLSAVSVGSSGDREESSLMDRSLSSSKAVNDDMFDLSYLAQFEHCSIGGCQVKFDLTLEQMAEQKSRDRFVCGLCFRVVCAAHCGTVPLKRQSEDKIRICQLCLYETDSDTDDEDSNDEVTNEEDGRMPDKDHGTRVVDSQLDGDDDEGSGSMELARIRGEFAMLNQRVSAKKSQLKAAISELKDNLDLFSVEDVSAQLDDLVSQIEIW